MNVIVYDIIFLYLSIFEMFMQISSNFTFTFAVI